MRRLSGILLALLIWATTSGVSAAIHHAQACHDSNAPHHDESTCRVWAALHAPVPQISAVPPLIVLERQVWLNQPIYDTIVSHRLILVESCRGPPVC